MIRHQATKEPARQPTADQPKSRQCLKCREQFLSEWSGQRLCRKCKGRSAWRSGVRTVPL